MLVTYDDYEKAALATHTPEQLADIRHRISTRIQAGVNYAVAREMSESKIGGVMADDMYSAIAGGIAASILALFLNAKRNGNSSEEASDEIGKLVADIIHKVGDGLAEGVEGKHIGEVVAAPAGIH